MSWQHPIWIAFLLLAAAALPLRRGRLIVLWLLRWLLRIAVPAGVFLCGVGHLSPGTLPHLPVSGLMPAAFSLSPICAEASSTAQNGIRPATGHRSRRCSTISLRW